MDFLSVEFYSIYPYWQIAETKSKNWDIIQRISRKQNQENFQKFYFGNTTSRNLRQQNPLENFVWILFPEVTLDKLSELDWH